MSQLAFDRLNAFSSPKNNTDSKLLSSSVKQPSASERWHCMTLHTSSLYNSSHYPFLTSAQKKVFICACHLALQMCPGENVLRPVSPVHSLPPFPIPIIYTTHYFWHQLFRRAQKSSVCTVTGHPPWASGHPTHVSHTPESFPFQLIFLQMLETESRSCQTAQGSFSQHLKWKSMLH